MKPTKERVWVIAESEEELGIAQIERIEESPAITRWRVRAEKAEAEVEQCRVQLAGCGVAALGYNDKPAKQGDYGWSQSYQDVLNIRADLELARPLLEAAMAEDNGTGDWEDRLSNAAVDYKEAKAKP